MSQQNLIAENPSMTSERLGATGEIFAGRENVYEVPDQHRRTQSEETHTKDRYYPLYFAVMGLLVVTALVLSAANDFLFFGWLCLAAPIFLGLMAIHLAGIKQVKRN